MKRIFSILLLIATAAAPVVGQGIPTPQEYENRDRRIAIKPKRPTRGIKSGLVIAYGHRLPPPYLLENRGGTLFVNGIQVIPSLVDEREQAARPKPIQTEASKKRSESLWKTTTEMQAMSRKGTAQDKVLEFAEGQPHVREAKWQHGMLMITDDEGKTLGVMLPQKGDTLPTDAERQARAEGAQRNALATIKHRLEKNECVIFTDGGTSGHPISKTFPAIIPEVMEDAALSKDEKLRRLMGVMFEPAARDIVANFTTEEWPRK